MTATPITFFHSPNSRSQVTHALLEELDVPYDMVALNMQADEQRSPEYLAINPMGKVPAIRHGETLITEQPAIMMYLADLYPEKNLAPAIGDALRGAYLRWMVFYGSCYEPAIMDRSMPERAPLPRMQCGYGTYDDVMNVLAAQLETGPWLLGERFTAADVLWGTALNYGFLFKLVPDLPAFKAYVERVMTRPAIVRALEKDQALAAKQKAETVAVTA